MQQKNASWIIIVCAVLLGTETTGAESYLRAVLLISIICCCDTVPFHFGLAHLILVIPCGLFIGGYGVILAFKILSIFYSFEVFNTFKVLVF